jgi:hypothetical protein
MLWNGNKCGKNMVLRISRKPSPLQIMMDQKQLENVEYLNYLGSMVTNYTRHAREIKSRIAMAKTAFGRKENLFTRRLKSNLRKKLVKFYFWSLALYDAETRIVRKVDQKYMKIFQTC